jgi:hypothetical protein
MEVGGCGMSFVARAVGSVWRATPQAGQRVSSPSLSLYGPSECRQLQCHAAGLAFIRLFGWTFELNMIETRSSSSEAFLGGRHAVRPFGAWRPTGPTIV